MIVETSGHAQYAVCTALVLHRRLITFAELSSICEKSIRLGVPFVGSGAQPVVAVLDAKDRGFAEQ